jgi:hypothetical protein
MAVLDTPCKPAKQIKLSADRPNSGGECNHCLCPEHSIEASMNPYEQAKHHKLSADQSDREAQFHCTVCVENSLCLSVGKSAISDLNLNHVLGITSISGLAWKHSSGRWIAVIHLGGPNLMFGFDLVCASLRIFPRRRDATALDLTIAILRSSTIPRVLLPSGVASRRVPSKPRRACNSPPIPAIRLGN